MNRPSAHAGTSCRQRTSGSSAVASSTISSEERRAAAAAACCRGRGSRSGRARRTTLRRDARRPRRSAGVHAVVRPRARGGARARGRRRRARRRRASASARLPAPDGYRAQRALLSALVAALPALAAAAAAEGGRARSACSRRSRARDADVAARAVARAAAGSTCTSGSARPSVFTAHDLLPRRTAGEARPLARGCSRASTASSSTASAAARRSRELGVDARVIPHPVYPSDGDARDDGRTLLALGVIRPYKGLGDAIEVDAAARRRAAARRGRPARCRSTTCRGARRASSGGSATSRRRSSTARSREATVARLPVPRRSSTSRGALLQALGAGVPAVVYDVGGLAEPVARFGAGRVVPAGDVDALDRGGPRAARRPRRARAARAPGAERARARADLGRIGARAPRALRGARVMFRRAPLRRRDRRGSSTSSCAEHARRARGGRRRGCAPTTRRARRGGGALRRLRRRRRDRRPRSSPTCATTTRSTLDERRTRTCGDVQPRGRASACPQFAPRDRESLSGRADRGLRAASATCRRRRSSGATARSTGCCFPRFDSGACFAALLGGPRARPLAARAARRRAGDASRRYRDDTLVLETEWRDADGPRARDRLHAAARRRRPTSCASSRASRAACAMRTELVDPLRLRLGRPVGAPASTTRRWSRSPGPTRSCCRTPVDARGRGHDARSPSSRSRAGERVPFVLTWFPSHERAAGADRRRARARRDRGVLARLDRRAARYDGRRTRDAVQRSLHRR